MSLTTPTVNGLAKTDLMRADIVDNYDIDATGGGLWTDTTHYKVTVPAGYSYFLYGGIVLRDANQAATTGVFNAANKEVLRLATTAAAATLFSYPDTGAGNLVLPVKVPETYYIQATLAGAQGATAYGTCYVLKVKQ